MAKKYLDSAGLTRLWNKINSIFVAKEAGKGLSTNDYTTKDKNKLNNIEEGANNYKLPVADSSNLGGIKSGGDITIDSAGVVQVNDNSHNHNIDNITNLDTTLNSKVDKIDGKGLSTNDYTTTEKNKLSDIASGAEVNTIVAIQRNGTAITPKDRVVNILVPVKTSELNNDSKYQTDVDVAETIVGVDLNIASGIITLTRKDGTTFTIDLPTEKIIKSGYYDSTSEEIVLVLADESEIRFCASQLIDEYYADNVTLEQYTDTADGNKKKFRLKTAYKTKIDGSEQTTNKTASVSASSTETQYPTAKAVYNAVKDLATKVQTFSQASTRANIESGETISTIFGKIRKWFADLKAVAFSGSYNDLIDKPTLDITNEGTSDVTDNTFIVTSRKDGLATNKTIYRRQATFFWNYIKDKISSVLGLTATNYNGIASKATADESGNNIQNGYTQKINVGSNDAADAGWILLCEMAGSSYAQMIVYPYNISNLAIEEPIFISAMSSGASIKAIILNDLNNLVKVCKIEDNLFRICVNGAKNLRYRGSFFSLYSRVTLGSTSQVAVSTLPGNEVEVEREYYRKLSGCLELTDSNLATYFANGVLTIPNGVTTVIFNTTAVKTVYLVQGTVQTNGYRLTIGGKWQPDTNSDYQGLEGCFPYYVDYHYYGYAGASLPNFDEYSHFADYVYFKGMWFSKMY